MKSDEDVPPIIKEFSRQRVRHIWALVSAGETPSDLEEAAVGRIMKDHPEFSTFWERGEGVSEEELEEVNPFFHLSLEAALENQLQSGEIREVKEALDHLVKKGFDPHEARHRIIEVLLDEIWHMMKEKRVFNEALYKRKLRTLVR